MSSSASESTQNKHSYSTSFTKFAILAICGIVGYKLYKSFDHGIKRVLITGSNKGLGFELAKHILETTTNYHVILSGRNADRINEAKLKLISISPSYKHRISTLLMDVSDKKSIENAANKLKHQFGADLHLHCIVNNAGIFPEAKRNAVKALDTAAQTIKTNYFGVVHVTQCFAALLEANARIVNISSGGAPMNVSKMSERRKKIIMNPNVTLQELASLISDFCDAYAKQDDERGFGSLHAYGFSKACVNAFTCFIAPRWLAQSGRRDVVINCCTPGMVDTDMTRDMTSYKKKSTAQGIVVPAQLVLNANLTQSGQFFGGNGIAEQYCLDEYIPVTQKKKNGS